MADNTTSSSPTTFSSPITSSPTEAAPDPLVPVAVSWAPYVGVFAGVAIIVAVVYGIYRYRNRPQDGYTSLRDVEDIPAQLIKEKKIAKDSERDAALLQCSFYLRSSQHYRLIDHLPDVGCRPKKHWFLVKAINDHKDKMLTMMPKSDTLIPPFSNATRQTLNDLFAFIKHPYLQPIDDVDFQLDNMQVVMVQPFCGLGSLKDLIHGVRCVESWDYKYCYPGNALPMHNIQNYGRQILEGILFLRKKGLPPCGHLHSGNVIVEKDTCRIAGYENSLLGYNNRMYNFLRKPLRKNMQALDTLCFGHLVFEMAAGQMLDCPVPTFEHYGMVADEPTKELLRFVFTDVDQMPEIEALVDHKFFRAVTLPKLDIPKAKKSAEVKALLKSIKKARQQQQPKSSVQPQESRTEEMIVDEARSAGTGSSYGARDPLNVKKFSSAKQAEKQQAEISSPKPPGTRKSSSSSLTKPLKKPKVSRKPSVAGEKEDGGTATAAAAAPTAAAPAAATPARSALLSQIKQGSKLRKAPNTIDPRV